MGIGRPTIRNEAQVTEILERVSQGEPLASVLRSDGMPGLTTFYNWLNTDEILSEKFARAREAGHDRIATEALEIADLSPSLVTTEGGMRVDPGEVQHRKLRIETRLKLLAKWDRRYSDRQQIEHSGTLTLADLVAKAHDPKA